MRLFGLVFLFVGTLILCASCKKPPEFDLSLYCPECIGSWTWDRTYNSGLTGIYFSEVNSEYVLNIDKNGQIMLLKDGFTIETFFIVDHLGSHFNQAPDGVVQDGHLFKMNKSFINAMDGSKNLAMRYLLDTDEVTFPLPFKTIEVQGNVKYGPNVYRRTN